MNCNSVWQAGTSASSQRQPLLCSDTNCWLQPGLAWGLERDQKVPSKTMQDMEEEFLQQAVFTSTPVDVEGNTHNHFRHSFCWKSVSKITFIFLFLAAKISAYLVWNLCLYLYSNGKSDYEIIFLTTAQIYTSIVHNNWSLVTVVDSDLSFVSEWAKSIFPDMPVWIMCTWF